MRKLTLMLCVGLAFHDALGQLAVNNAAPNLDAINRNFSLDQQPAPKSLFLSKLFLKAYSGVGFVSPGSYRINSTSAITIYDPVGGNTITVVETESKKGIGRGVKFGVGIGYAMNDFVNLGIDIEYQKGQTVTNDLGSYGNPYNFDSTFAEMHCNTTSVSPHILFKALAKPRYFIYNRLGAIFTMPFTLYRRQGGHASESQNWPPVADTIGSNLLTRNYNLERTDRVSFGIGFNVALGINFKLTERMRFFTEFFGNFSALKSNTSASSSVDKNINDTYYPEYDYTVDPPVYLGYTLQRFTTTTHINESTKYYKDGTLTNQTKIVETSPYPNSESYITSNGTSDRFTINYNSIGINCGFLFRF